MKAFFSSLASFLRKYFAFFSGMLRNSDNKPSSSGAAGIYIVGIGGLSFLAGTINFFITKDATMMNTAIAFTSIGAGLLGWRKHKDGDLSSIIANGNINSSMTNKTNPQT